MPKLIDHKKKKEQIIEYTWQSIVNSGAKGATVRNIAKLAKMTPGQIRYYYPTHSALLDAVMEKVNHKVSQRIQEIFGQETLPEKERIIQAILAVLPLDDDRYADMEVWMAFQYEIHQAGTNSMGDEIRMLIQKSLQHLNEKQMLQKDLPLEFTTMRAHALVDGLALHKLLTPDRIDNKDAIKLIRAEVHSWLKEEYQ
ncbi:TetR family transcriptional regulator [Marinococcus halophilus]|uniref:HTH-type transcriptional regulator PksA n=1 Tax=Marinococcus halophilus TaxID=1371 RepID=A0A510Y923_MARHA|nr:TetR family transcriptional regulator C-terminal domain-containing protein [Marinococcus halophilus]OZT79186.1 TetR family transcriptional regulator [Marinococcus halophilus]GEK59849.1 HTH-type transcriptional regulator PksA [Marinococcus halophilus]